MGSRCRANVRSTQSGARWTEVCRFSGLKIYPGHGMRLTKMDSQTYLFLSAKCKRLFNLRLRPAKLAWTTQYRKAHKKDQTTEIARQKKRAEKSDVRAAARDAALREIKERQRKAKDAKK